MPRHNSHGGPVQFSRLVNCCWFCFKWIALPALVVGTAAIPVLYRRVDEEIRCRCEKLMAEHYRGLRVNVRSARLVEGQGIRIYDLTIVDPSLKGPQAELVHVEEMLLDCSTDWRKLLSGELTIRRITVRRPTLRARVWPTAGGASSGCFRRRISAIARHRWRCRVE